MLAVYITLGVVFAVALHAVGLTRIDPATRGAGWSFRLLITPGVVALWPYLAVRWRRAAAGGRPGGAQRPLSASGLRAFHRNLSMFLMVVVPLLAAAGIILRPARPVPDPVARSLLPEPLQLPEMLATHERPFGNLPIVLKLRGAGPERRQIELEVAEDLQSPNLLIYWVADETAFPSAAVYLGAVWGPGVRRYDLDVATARRGGLLMLYSLTHQEQVASFRLPGE